MSLADAAAAMESKFWGAYRVARAARINDGGSLTLISGFLSERPLATAVLQGAINAALEALARRLALELAPVRVNAVSPGMIETPIWDDLGSNRCGDLQSILGITIKDDEPRSGSKWQCFSQLLDDPRACRMLCDIEVQDTPTIVTDDEKAIEHPEGDRRNGEEVHRGNRFPVITEKGKPALGWLRISRCPFHPTRDRSLRDIKAEHEKLAMDAWRSPR